MIMTNLPKQQRYVYQKAFSVKGVIENLKTYQVATGDVQPSVLCKGAGSSQGNLGRQPPLSGEAVTNAAKERSRRKRKKYRERRKQRKKVRSELSGARTDVEVLKEHSGSGEEDEPTSSCVGDINVGSLGLLASLYSSSDEETSQPTGMREESTAQTLPIPDVILDMYTKEDENAECSSALEEFSQKSTTHLGFFETVDSDDDDEQPTAKGSSSLEKATKVTSKEQWNPTKAKWRFPTSDLQTYLCASCGKVGHLTQDCTVASGSQGSLQIPANLKSLYSRAHKLASSKDLHCTDCGLTSNLVCCLECRSVYCDGRGHLSAHLRSYPTHNTLYSCKLKKLVKCCNAVCQVVSVYELLVCSHCLTNAFSYHYSMVTACWSRAGLKKIQNAIACEEHFHWHRINCSSSFEENFISKDKHLANTVSEFFF